MKTKAKARAGAQGTSEEIAINNPPKLSLQERLQRLTEPGRKFENSQPESAMPNVTNEPGVPPNSQISVADLEEHPYAAIFPMMEPGETAELKENIKQHGLLDPIVLFQGKILDGRQRLAACKLAEVVPKFVQFQGDAAAAVQFVRAKNIYRRNLTKSQRAALGAELLVNLEKEAAERKRLLSGTRRNPDGSPSAGQVPEKIPGREGEARKQAAQMLEVNERYISDAKVIKERDPDLHALVKSGKISLKTAKKRLAEKIAVRPSKGKTGAELSDPRITQPVQSTVIDAESVQKIASGAFTVVVWDDHGIDDEPLEFYSRTAYPNCALFHIWRTGIFQERRKDGGFSYDLLLTLRTGKDSISDKTPVRINLSTRFVSISVCGVVPPSEGAIEDILEYHELLEQIESAWPDARKILVGNDGRQGWDAHPQTTK